MLSHRSSGAFESITFRLWQPRNDRVTESIRANSWVRAAFGDRLEICRELRTLCYLVQVGATNRGWRQDREPRRANQQWVVRHVERMGPPIRTNRRPQNIALPYTSPSSTRRASPVACFGIVVPPHSDRCD